MTTNLTSYFTDQLEYEQRNDDLVNQGRMRASQAQRLNEEWEDREWNQRWKVDFPRKVMIGLSKYHAMILCMRFYETVVCEKVLKLDKISLDRLTLDLFKYSLRRKEYQDELRNNETCYQTNDSPMDLVEPYKVDTFRDIVKTCIWANLIGFVADCTVQQFILLYMYARYWWRRRTRQLEEEMTTTIDDATSKDGQKTHNDEEEEDGEGNTMLSLQAINGSLLLSFLLKSTKLAVYRGMALVCSSVGGAVGCLLYPGYGVVFGSQLGDAISGP